MNLVNSIITNCLSFLPKWIAKPFARPYVAGETDDEALNVAQKLNNQGYKVTLDILGEHVIDKRVAENIALQYSNLYQKIDDMDLDCTISVKPTHVGLSISLSEAISNILNIVKQAKKFKNFLRLDMESSVHTAKTIDIFKECLKVYENIGIAIQAYLYRSLDDVNELKGPNFNSRLCKGIYNEPKSLAYQSREDVRSNFILLAKSMAISNSFCGYATHDQDLIDRLLHWIKLEKIPSQLFEFQVLYGVPMGNRLEKLLEQGFDVRVYVPYGPDWFDYSIRRLKENPNIAKYVLSNYMK